MRDAGMLTIGELAERARTPATTIRYYEKIGLIPRASRTMAGQRVYRAGDLQRLALIRRCREFDLPIERVRSIAHLLDTDAPCEGARDLARDHLSALRERIVELKAVEVTLEGFLARCDCAGKSAHSCAAMKELSEAP
jgi:DNA-binding transcriptional MerR regulator